MHGKLRGSDSEKCLCLSMHVGMRVHLGREEGQILPVHILMTFLALV